MFFTDVEKIQVLKLLIQTKSLLPIPQSREDENMNHGSTNADSQCEVLSLSASVFTSGIQLLPQLMWLKSSIVAIMCIQFFYSG